MDLSQRKTTDGVTRVSTERPEGSRTTIVSPNWCDKTTWYYKATKKQGITLVDSGDHTTYNPDTGDEAPWIDNYHGKYFAEDFLLTEDGDLPRLKVYVDSVEKTEQDPHTASGGDFTVNYATGAVTFLSALTGTETVTADVWQAGSSCWILAPAEGKKLKILYSEVQFSEDIELKDTVKFQPYGLVEIFAPQYCPVPYPAGTMIPLGNPVVYKTFMDFINEANGAYPSIKANTSATPEWRNLQHDMDTFPFNYQATTNLIDGMEIRIFLEHEAVFGGHAATATFYCMSEDMG
ncbi:MAG: hypothetical protein GWN58_33895 [Anaerolineae bacterium]|nr:DUF2460 domain-containing protein [Thermoplasmata archaeon]NIV34272.1 hypothetical protein [Anaerolineae bacterium]NIY06121.1 hypothetical protein [Thermoplasmata archaeon]